MSRLDRLADPDDRSQDSWRGQAVRERQERERKQREAIQRQRERDQKKINKK